MCFHVRDILTAHTHTLHLVVGFYEEGCVESQESHSLCFKSGVSNTRACIPSPRPLCKIPLLCSQSPPPVCVLCSVCCDFKRTQKCIMHARKSACVAEAFTQQQSARGRGAWEAQRSSTPSPLMAGEEGVVVEEEEGIMGGGSKGGATNRLAAAPASSTGGGHSVPRRVDPSLACSGCL